MDREIEMRVLKAESRKFRSSLSATFRDTIREGDCSVEEDMEEDIEGLATMVSASGGCFPTPLNTESNPMCCSEAEAVHALDRQSTMSDIL